MIREATLEDIPKLLDMGYKFFTASPYNNYTYFDRDSLYNTFIKLIEDEMGILLIGNKSMVGGLVYPYYFNNNYMTGQELFWWSEEPGEGRSLLAAFEEAVKDRGADTITMASLDNLDPERVDKIYKMRGYIPAEHHYIRRV